MKRLVSRVRMKWSRRNTLRVVAQIVVLALIASPIVKAAPPGGAPSSQKGPARKALHADDQVVGFSGYMKDPETGLYYAKARYYDPAVGRFTSEDPESGHDLEPPSLHRYLYAYANPTTYVDRTGRQSTGVGDEAFGYLKLGEQDEWALRERANQLAIDAHRPIMKPALQVIASAWREFNNVVDNFKSSTSGDVPGPFEDISVNEERELRVAAERESARRESPVADMVGTTLFQVGAAAAIGPEGSALRFASVESSTAVVSELSSGGSALRQTISPSSAVQARLHAGSSVSDAYAFQNPGSATAASRNASQARFADARAGAGGSWRYHDEVADASVVQQAYPTSCGQACAEMLLADRGIQVRQVEMGRDLSSATSLANSMNKFDRGWIGAAVDQKSFGPLTETGSWAAMMWEQRARYGHWVLVDGVNDAGMVRVRDPYNATRYTMTRDDFDASWNGYSVFKK